MKKGLFLICFFCAFQAMAEPAFLKNIPTAFHGQFVQEKYLADLEVTLTSAGHFQFQQDKGILWHIQKPTDSSFVATKTALCTTISGKTSIQTAEQLPVLGQIVAQVEAFLAADFSLIEEKFDVTEQGNSVTLRPKEESLQPLIEKIELNGDTFLQTIIITQPDKDETRLTFKQVQKGVLYDITCP